MGTSIGAAVGALYASGYSGRTLDSLARITPLSDMLRSYRPRAPRSLGVLRPLVTWEQGERRFTLQNASLVESEVNALVNVAMLRGNLLARGDFDSLPIPFRAMATDLGTGEPVVMSSGDLAQAVRASIAVPLVFAPELRDGRVLTGPLRTEGQTLRVGDPVRHDPPRPAAAPSTTRTTSPRR